MPLADKLNFEIGARTWRFNTDDPGIHKRSGYFETVPRNGRTKSKPSSTVSSAAPPVPAPTQTAPKPKSIIQASPQDLGPSEEEVRIELEKRILAEEKLRIEEMNREAQKTLEHAEMIRQQVAEAQERNAIAAEREAEQRLVHQQAIEEEKQQLRFEAERKLQELREEVAVGRQKREAELALWQERTLALVSEVEARAKAREAEEEARAAKRERELMQERDEAMNRMKQDAIEEYKRTHDELRRAQEEQLRKELEDARQKIIEESAARKASFEAEKEATILKFREEARLECQKQLDSHLQLGKESTEAALKEASAKAAEEFKVQSQEAIKNLRTYSRSERSVPQKSPASQAASFKPTPDSKAASSREPQGVKPIPPPNQSQATDEEILKKREAMRQRLLLGVYTPNVNRINEWGIRSAPAPFPAVAPSPSTWGTPANRHRANSVGQMNLSTPFVTGSAVVHHLNAPQIAPTRGGYNPDVYSRPGNTRPSRGDLYCNPPIAQAVSRAIAHASPLPGSSANTSSDPWTTSHNKPQKTVIKPQAHHSAQINGDAKETYYDYDDQPLPVTPMSKVSGFTIISLIGFVDGTSIRDLTKEQNEVTLEKDRKIATVAMWRKAKRQGADHVVGLKFQTQSMTPFQTAIIASGTAVRMVRCSPTVVPPGPESEQKALPPNKPGQGQKGTGSTGEKQNNKTKNKGKQKDEWGGQTNDESAGNTGWDASVGTSDQANQDHGNLANEWAAVGWGNDTQDTQKKTQKKKGKQAQPTEPTNQTSQWDSWEGAASKEQGNNDNETTDAAGWSNEDAANTRGWSYDDTNESKKGQKGNKAKKDSGGDSQKKGKQEKAKQARDNAESQTSAPDNDSTKWAKPNENSRKADKPTGHPPNPSPAGPTTQSLGGYGPVNPGAMIVSRPRGDWHQSPHLPAHASKPWMHPGPHRYDYDDPYAMYPYRSSPRYEADYWGRPAAGPDYYPLYHHHYPSYLIPPPALPLQYSHGYGQRTPMRLESELGGNGQSYPLREESNPAPDPYSSRSPRKPNGNAWDSAPQPQADHSGWNNPNSTSWGSSSRGQGQASQNQSNQNQNPKGKGKNQPSKKGQSEDSSCGNGETSNGWGDDWENNCSNQQSNKPQNGGNTNNNKGEGKKAGGKGGKNAANQPPPQRQKGNNGGKNSQGNNGNYSSTWNNNEEEETESEPESGLGFLAEMAF